MICYSKGTPKKSSKINRKKRLKKQFIEHLTGRVVLMKNEHDQNRDFPHTHSIRLPAQESHKQGNQNCCCESKKRVSLQLLHQNRALLLRKMAAAPSCAQLTEPELFA